MVELAFLAVIGLWLLLQLALSRNKAPVTDICASIGCPPFSFPRRMPSGKNEPRLPSLFPSAGQQQNFSFAAGCGTMGKKEMIAWI
ncbi:MAG: hypothetical protein IJU18_05745 [Oscillospiraceae bacterium]|nr:hypothetical protein [Oscillospiraceae bacterium]